MATDVILDFRPPDPAPARPQERDERLLLERIVAQDVAAFRALYHVYHRRMSRFLHRFVRQRDLVEEIINDTMYVVWCKQVPSVAIRRCRPGFSGSPTARR